MAAASFFWPSSKNIAYATTDTFTTSGTWNVPANVHSVVIEAWGGGGAGGGTTAKGGGGGGGAGGQYAKVSLNGLNTNDAYTVTVAASVSGTTGNGANGNDSLVKNPSSTTVVQAKGGAGGTGATNTLLSSPGAGSASGGIGDLVNRGGSGDNGNDTLDCPSLSTPYGGGGGGGAGSSGSGSDALCANSTGTSANGGAGGTISAATVGVAGSNYGGGGSGGSSSTNTAKAGGGGAPGLVTFTYSTNFAPATPTLGTPASSATNISITPQFTLSTSDPDGDYIEYRIYLYQSDCTTAVGSSPFAQAGSQTGWSNQNANSGQAYSSGSTATYTYQGTLANNTTYCWKADSIDPAGSGTYSSASATQTFTTTAGGGVIINGGTTIRGGTNIQ